MKNTLRIFAATTLFSLGAAAQAGDPQITSGAADCTSIDDVAARNACLVDQAATGGAMTPTEAQIAASSTIGGLATPSIVIGAVAIGVSVAIIANADDNANLNGTVSTTTGTN